MTTPGSPDVAIHADLYPLVEALLTKLDQILKKLNTHPIGLTNVPEGVRRVDCPEWDRETILQAMEMYREISKERSLLDTEDQCKWLRRAEEAEVACRAIKSNSLDFRKGRELMEKLEKLEKVRWTKGAEE